MPTERTWVKAPVHLGDIIAVKTGIRATNATSKGWSSPCILYPRAAPLVSIVTTKRGVKMWDDFSMETLLVSNYELAIQLQSQVQSTSVQPLVISISHPQTIPETFWLYPIAIIKYFQTRCQYYNKRVFSYIKFENIFCIPLRSQ